MNEIPILERIKKATPPGTKIPKPESDESYIVVGWGTSRGEEALVYELPVKPTSMKASQKRIHASAFRFADEVLKTTDEITRSWFAANFPELERDGSCNFTTLGGIFELLGLAVYEGRGVYRRRATSAG